MNAAQDDGPVMLACIFDIGAGQIEVFAVRQIVETVEIAETQISLEEAQKLIPEAEVGQEIEFLRFQSRAFLFTASPVPASRSVSSK